MRKRDGLSLGSFLDESPAFRGGARLSSKDTQGVRWNPYEDQGRPNELSMAHWHRLYCFRPALGSSFIGEHWGDIQSGVETSFVPLRISKLLPMATIDFLPHPITTEGRQTITALVPQGESLDKVLRDIVPPTLSAVAVVNGTLISRPKWPTTIITRDSIIQVRAMMQGGDGSNPFAIILSIAAVVLAPYLAPLILGPALAGTIVGSIVTAGIGIGGVLLANALFPPRFPDDLSGDAEKQRQFSLSGGSNRARPHEPFLLLLGQHRVFPDLVSREYTEFGTLYCSSHRHSSCDWWWEPLWGIPGLFWSR